MMSHEETVIAIEPNNHTMDTAKTIEQQLTDAHDEIADLKMQIAWLERSYE